MPLCTGPCAACLRPLNCPAPTLPPTLQPPPTAAAAGHTHRAGRHWSPHGTHFNRRRGQHGQPAPAAAAAKALLDQARVRVTVRVTAGRVTAVRVRVRAVRLVERRSGGGSLARVRGVPRQARLARAGKVRQQRRRRWWVAVHERGRPLRFLQSGLRAKAQQLVMRGWWGRSPSPSHQPRRAALRQPPRQPRYAAAAVAAAAAAAGRTMACPA